MLKISFAYRKQLQQMLGNFMLPQALVDLSSLFLFFAFFGSHFVAIVSLKILLVSQFCKFVLNLFFGGIYACTFFKSWLASNLSFMEFSAQMICRNFEQWASLISVTLSMGFLGACFSETMCHLFSIDISSPWRSSQGGPGRGSARIEWKGQGCLKMI